VDALAIVVAFDVGEQLAPSLLAGLESDAVDEFDFEGVEEALHGRVVVAAALRDMGCVAPAPSTSSSRQAPDAYWHPRPG
jgi:hypothetical protein